MLFTFYFSEELWKDITADMADIGRLGGDTDDMGAILIITILAVDGGEIEEHLIIKII